MPSQHKTPLVGWHPPADLADWARTEAERRGVPLSVVLTEALEGARRAAHLDNSTEGGPDSVAEKNSSEEGQ